MNRLFCGFGALLLTAAIGALPPSAYAQVPVESASYAVEIAGVEQDDGDEEPTRRRGPKLPEKVEDCFTFFDGGDFYSSVFGPGGWESKEVLFFEMYTVTVEDYGDDEATVTLTLLKVGDKLIGIGRNSELKLKSYRIKGEADECGSTPG